MSGAFFGLKPDLSLFKRVTTILRGQYNSTAFDNEQQTLKSRLKEKTAAVNKNYAVLHKQRRNARNMVKDHLPQESWKEFGMKQRVKYLGKRTKKTVV